MIQPDGGDERNVGVDDVDRVEASPEQALYAGILLTRAGRPVEALPLLDRAVVGLGDDAEALLARDRLLDAAEEARGAELQAVSAGAVPRLPEIYRMLGRDQEGEQLLAASNLSFQ